MTLQMYQQMKKNNITYKSPDQKRRSSASSTDLQSLDHVPCKLKEAVLKRNLLSTYFI